MNYKFVCPKCKKDTYIEEVVSDVTNTYKIENMWSDEDFETALIDVHTSTIDDIRYQCSNCGYVLDMSKEDIYKKYVKKELKEALSSIDGKRIII
jgi:rubredoxin